MRRPVRGSTTIEGVNLEDALQRPEAINPRLAVELRAHSIATLAELRKTRGSRDGNRGPRACMLAGFEDPLDGGEGVFTWDDTSTLADDEGVAVAAVFGVAVGRWRRTQLYPTPFGQLRRAPQVLTSGTSFAPLSAGRPALVELVGGGGGGGGTNTLAASSAVGCGGSAGGYARKYYASLPASCTIAIGAAGAAGASAGGNGGAGGDTTFSDGTTTVTAKGGPGGAGQTPAAATVVLTAGPAASAVSTNGDVNGAGAPGDGSLRFNGVAAGAISGMGGSGPWGGGGGSLVTTAAGLVGTGRGAGGGGGASINGGAAQAGGAGTAGAVVVWEFS